jgi:hypothetical protein
MLVHKAASAHCAKYGKQALVTNIGVKAGGRAFFECR